VVLLCRLYKNRVLCVHQERGVRVPGLVSYERGRAMPLYKGATSKVILALLSVRELEVLIERDRAEVVRAGLSRDATTLRASLESIRQERRCVSHGEVDPNACGVAVPICYHSRVIGSLSVVLPAVDANGRALKSASRLVVQAGNRIEADLENEAIKAPKRKQAR